MDLKTSNTSAPGGVGGVSGGMATMIGSSATCVVVAHPDDETIGCGGQLGKETTVILVTDGAPRDLADAKKYGFATAGAYARARSEEFRNAMRIAGVEATVALGIPDQDAARQMVEITLRLVELMRDRAPRFVITHAYEGGHPDHDAVAFAVHSACRILARTECPPALFEMPFYRLGAAGVALQSFAETTGLRQINIDLDARARDRKQRMLAAYRTQQQTLSPFSICRESFRVPKTYDFSELPNDGRLLYEGRPWGITGSEWRGLAREATRRLERCEPTA